MKFDIQDSIINDTKELQELINQFNKEISFEKKEFFFMVLYYNWISILNNKIYNYQKESEFQYIPINEDMNKDDDKDIDEDKKEDNNNDKKNDKSEVKNKDEDNEDDINICYLSSLDFLKDNINKLSSIVKQVLKIKDNKENKELLNIIENEMGLGIGD